MSLSDSCGPAPFSRSASSERPSVDDPRASSDCVWVWSPWDHRCVEGV